MNKSPPGCQHLYGAEQSARADQRHQMVYHSKGEQPGEDLVGWEAGREADQNNRIEYAEATRDMTDQPGHESQNKHRKNVRIPDGRSMRQAGVEHSGYER